MTKKIKASFTNNVLEYSAGDKVIQIYPVARPMIGVVVGSNKVEGKVYVNWNGRTMQVDPEEIQLAIGTPFFPISRKASKSEDRKLEKIITALAKSGNPQSTKENMPSRFYIELKKNLVEAGIASDEADDIANQYEDGFIKRTSIACLDPVAPVCGEPVVVLSDDGSKPGKVGILVGSEGADAIVDLNSGWSPTSIGSQLLKIPMIAVVPINDSLRERLNKNVCYASINTNKEINASKRVANQAFNLYISSVKNVDVVDIKGFKAWVETSCVSDGGELSVVVSSVIEKEGECDPLLKIFPIFSQKLAGFDIQNETDYKNAIQRIVPLIENCKSSILKYFQSNIIPNYVEREVSKSLTASAEVEYKAIFSIDGKKINLERMGKFQLGEVLDDGTVRDLTWKEFKESSAPKKEQKSVEEKFIQALLKKESNFGRKVDFNSFVKRNSPSFEEKVDWILDNTSAKYTKRGIKASKIDKVIIHDLNNNSEYEITNLEEAKDETDKSAAEEAFKSKETVTMGKVVAEYVALS